MDETEPKATFGAAIGGFMLVAWPMYFFVFDSSTGFLWAFGGLNVLVLSVYFIVLNKRNEKDNELAGLQREYIIGQTLKYRKALAKKRTQLITTDDYGDINDLKWNQEITRFWESKIGTIPGNLAMNGENPIISGEEIAGIIDSIAVEGQEKFQDLYSYDESMDGIEYEHFCADVLRKAGWSADVSQASNDQGVDILAKNEGYAVAIQCKKYSSPVGNKAVQEVVSGKEFYGADLAVVVTNNSYTRSAKQLANTTGVLLLNHADLVILDKIIDQPS